MINVTIRTQTLICSIYVTSMATINPLRVLLSHKHTGLATQTQPDYETSQNVDYAVKVLHSIRQQIWKTQQ